VRFMARLKVVPWYVSCGSKCVREVNRPHPFAESKNRFCERMAPTRNGLSRIDPRYGCGIRAACGSKGASSPFANSNRRRSSSSSSA
jgi:hypothetical protein